MLCEVNDFARLFVFVPRNS